MIKYIIFDVGKVLVEYDPDSYMNRLGFDAKTKRVLNEAMFENPLWNEFDRGDMSTEEILQKFIFNAPDYEKEIIKAFQSIGDAIELFSYSVDWIKELKNRGYRVYILSNYPEFTYEQTEKKMKFLDYVDGTVFSYSCKVIKPEKEIYEHLCEKYSLLPEESVFIDDRNENIAQAINLGFYGIQFKDYEQGKSALDRLLTRN